jgi:D-tyrosyl-tRNA(Tyr) deacylase
LKVLLQRCKESNVSIKSKIVGKIKSGLVIFVGFEKKDSKEDIVLIIDKILNFRIFNDINQKMNLSIKDINGSVLIISQFTLCAETKKGRRPSFLNAANPDNSIQLYDFFIKEFQKFINVQSGVFGQEMQVKLINDGPATFILES